MAARWRPCLSGERSWTLLSSIPGSHFLFPFLCLQPLLRSTDFGSRHSSRSYSGLCCVAVPYIFTFRMKICEFMSHFVWTQDNPSALRTHQTCRILLICAARSGFFNTLQPWIHADPVSQYSCRSCRDCLLWGFQINFTNDRTVLASVRITYVPNLPAIE